MRALPLLTGLLLSAVAATHAAEPVTVLGLPLGGKMIAGVRACNYGAARANVEMPTCWIYSTSEGKAGRHGQLHVHGQDKMPAWAAGADFNANVGHDGTLTDFTVTSKPPSDAPNIMDSISARFGRPSYTKPDGALKWSALWVTPAIQISLICDARDSCRTRFVSAATAAEERRRINERMKIEAARPISP